MQLSRRLAFLVAIVSLIPAIVAKTNFDVCLANVRAGLYGQDGALDNYGNPISFANATAVSYDLCKSACGTGPESFVWAVFSAQFSAWLLPWLALVSQLPFGSQLRSDNVMSVLLTVGSPALAGYSLILTVLNGQWVAQRLSGINYPNIGLAWRVLSGLQQSALYVDDSEGLLASLIVLPENDEWWEELAHGLNYSQLWSAATVSQIAWVLIAYGKLLSHRL